MGQPIARRIQKPNLAVLVSVAVLSLTVCVLVAWAVHSFLDGKSTHDSNSWLFAFEATSAFVVAVATVVLATVTLSYVRLTRVLVSIQGDFITPARAQRREETAHNIARLLTDAIGPLSWAADVFPLGESISPDPTLIRGASEIGNVALELARLQASLPLSLVDACESTHKACAYAQSAQNSLYESMRQAAMFVTGDPSRSGSTWNWDDCRKMHAKLSAQRRIWECRWENLISGSFVLEAQSEIHSLRRKVISYLAEEPVNID
jgi:hypothetical protein